MRRARLPIAVVLVTSAVLALALAAASSAAKGVARASLPSLPSKPMAAADRARISAIVRELLADSQYEPEVPGFVVGIWSPAQGTYRASFGTADLKTGARPKLTSSFRIGSVSKTFTATVILQLVDEGKLSLGGRVKQYLPALARRYPAIGSRTVAQLLGMRSGLPEYADAAVKRATRSPGRVWTADELITLGMRSGRVRPAGGSKATYSNTNYVLLGEVAGAVTGAPIDRLVRERLLRPLGLRHTVYPAPTDRSLPAPFTRGYVGPSGAEEIVKLGGAVKPGADVTTWNPSWGNAAGMMISTIDDLARWGNGLFGNALLPAKLGRQRLVSRPLDLTSRYDLGVMTLTGGQWTGHEGGIPGWTTWALKNTRTGTVVVTSVNACCGGVVANLTLALLERLYPESFVTGPPLPGGTPFALSAVTSFTPSSGWRINAARSTEGSLTAVKPGLVLEASDQAEIPAGQTFESWTTLLHDVDAAPGRVVGALTPFTTDSGLPATSWTTRSVTGSTKTWFVTNRTRLLRIDVRGSAAAVRAATGELDRMARSVTMTPP